MKKFKYLSGSYEQTMELAAKIASQLKGGEIIELVSDFGGGKTTFVKGLLSILNKKSNVTSPSFTLLNEYKLNNLDIYHYDFYRLHDAGLMKKEISEKLNQKNSVVIIEWSDVIKDILPNDKISINFKVLSENSRQINCEYTDKYNYIFKNL
ncbi:MAG TPA: tRNA (adenosine(37)-N6)-threonylcarbamoyltransferase complex ATPase subunit type 1 TsaE [Patescibacteria group bacterium]|nr:tRNA (adenosine(37)-N6)-threonylcarbamoyltransferase complex ATPase subunit type 1 TsaE [Patescibacteria group bacterium]